MSGPAPSRRTRTRRRLAVAVRGILPVVLVVLASVVAVSGSTGLAVLFAATALLFVGLVAWLTLVEAALRRTPPPPCDAQGRTRPGNRPEPRRPRRGGRPPTATRRRGH
ncbi:hypothetical protein [Patulibacter sp. SYSU D01012]|uniref:hypothetical protein n=1 Tax=Patulibacter sp. SYSU D01012 TaxID=2817381 RepID=UPI001B30F1DF|nr:hypothetical protein [Patulibacter sp. SYSU D01012]